jgi:hypothetical protein
MGDSRRRIPDSAPPESAPHQLIIDPAQLLAALAAPALLCIGCVGHGDLRMDQKNEEKLKR